MRKPLRILYVDNSHTFGGAIVCLQAIIKNLGQGFEPVVVTRQPDSYCWLAFPGVSLVRDHLKPPWERPAKLEAARRWLTRFGATGRLSSGLLSALWQSPRDLLHLWQLTRAGRRHRVGLVHLNNCLAGQETGVLAARLLGVPCVVHERTFTHENGQLARLMAPLVDRHVAISSAVKRQLVRLGLPENKIVVIPDFVSHDEMQDGPPDPRLKLKLGLEHGQLAFGLFGRVVDWKGQREFVAAAAKVFKAVPNSKAFIVGDQSDGPVAYMEQVKRDIAQLGIEKQCILTGYRRDVAAVMKCMDLVVLASRDYHEAFGRVLIEAMALSKPVVATDCGGPADIVEDGKNGLLVPMRDSEGMAQAIIRLLTREDLPALGAAARARVEKRFTAEVCMPALEQVYAEALSRRGWPQAA